MDLKNNQIIQLLNLVIFAAHTAWLKLGTQHFENG